MSNFLLKPNSYTRLVKLANQRRNLITENNPEVNIPFSPIGAISHVTVGLRTSFGNLRFLFLLPWLIGISLGLYWMSSDIYFSWKNKENRYLEMIAHRKQVYGEKYFVHNPRKADLERFQRIDGAGRLPFFEYLDIRYRDSAYAERRLKADVAFGGFGLLICMVLIVAILSFHRRAPLYFDRERKIVYTWRSGRAWAQYYDELWYYNNNVAMTFILYRFDKKGRFKMKRFVVTPSGNPFHNGEALYRPVLAFIVQFMEKGRDAVWTSDWEGRRGWYLFEDRRPEDLHAQIDKVLAYIDEADVNSKVDQQAAEWGFR